MMGQQPLTDSLFYYFRLEDQIPNDHLLKRLDRFIDFGFVRERLRDTYSAVGRPSIDPEVLLRLLLVGYLYGITSERRLMEEVRMHLAYRWFSRLGFEREIPDHSTFSKNRHGRFRGAGVFLEVFEEIVRRCLEAGLVEGKRLTVDGTMVTANASPQRGTKPERLGEVARVCDARCATTWRMWHEKIPCRRTSTNPRNDRWRQDTFPRPILMRVGRANWGHGAFLPI
jgi:transposase